MDNYRYNKILEHLMSNINYAPKKGMIVASPSNFPPYKFHWVRDASLVMRVPIDLYRKTKDHKYLLMIFNYVENVTHIQNLETITGIGEPKVNIDGTAFNGNWGRPQNDGPALRALNFIHLYELLKDTYPHFCQSMIIPCLVKDVQYVMDHLYSICFDLWEEIKGWHFYTRIVQFKMLKTLIEKQSLFQRFKKIKFNKIRENKYLLEKNLKHHMDDSEIISSFDEAGNIMRMADSSILLGLCHVDFDSDIVNLFSKQRFMKSAQHLLGIFNEKYNTTQGFYIGRYKNDGYFDGHAWIIATCALGQLLVFSKQEENKEKAHQIFKHICGIDTQLLLAEQYDPINNKQYSAEKLTWNYVELYFLHKALFDQ